MTPEQGPVFVERRAYRQRRVVDAARLLPILGVALFCLPLLWIGERAEPTPTTYAMLYVFGVWLVLAGAAALVARHLKLDETPDDPAGEEDA